MTAVEKAAAGIRARRFDATPSRQACRYCAYNQICPFTATQGVGARTHERGPVGDSQ